MIASIRGEVLTRMPGEVVIEVAAVSINYPDILVVVMTGYGTVKDAVALIKRGAVDLITKPFGAFALLSNAGADGRSNGFCSPARFRPGARDSTSIPTGFRISISRTCTRKDGGRRRQTLIGVRCILS